MTTGLGIDRDSARRLRAPHATAALAPGMHHVWSAEDPALFHRVLAHWLAHAEPSPELLPVTP